MKKYQCDFLIIGGGASAVALLAQFSKIPPKISFHIIVIETKSHFGPGFPYDEDVVFPEHLNNTTAAWIDITNTRSRSATGDFVQWLESRPPEERKAFNISMDLEEQIASPPSRMVVGKYLTERFQDFVTECRAIGYTIDLLPNTSAVNVEYGHSDFVVDLSNGGIVNATDIFLATGHWHHSRFPGVNGYFPSPWPASSLRNGIPANQHVAIFGSNLSAIDAALTLAHTFGHFERKEANELVYMPSQTCGDFKMTMYSRSGHLPEVRGLLSKKAFPPEYLTDDNIKAITIGNQGFLPLDEFFDLVKDELAEQEPSIVDIPGFWQMRPDEFMQHISNTFSQTPAERLTSEIHRARQSIQTGKHIVLQSFFVDSLHTINKAVNLFSTEDTIRFKDHVLPTMYKLIVAMPIKNAEILLALMKAGKLFLESVKDTCRVKPAEDNLGMCLEYEKDGKTVNKYHRYFVDALGQSGDIDADPSPLTKSLLRNGLAQPLYTAFRDNNAGLLAYQTQTTADRQCKTVIQNQKTFYHKAPGVAMNVEASRLVPEKEISGSAIYTSGPFIFGHLAITQGLIVIGPWIKRAVNHIKRRHHLDDRLMDMDVKKNDGTGRRNSRTA